MNIYIQFPGPSVGTVIKRQAHIGELVGPRHYLSSPVQYPVPMEEVCPTTHTYHQGGWQSTDFSFPVWF